MMNQLTYRIVFLSTLMAILLSSTVRSAELHAEQTLSQPLIEGRLVRVSFKTSPENSQAAPAATIGKVKSKGERRLKDSGLFSGKDDNKFILTIVAQDQQWDCSGVGHRVGHQNKLQHRLGQLSDRFQYTLKQIRPEKRVVFESNIHIIDRQQYGMEPFCLKGWHETQSERAALKSLEMFELQLKRFAGQDVEAEIAVASRQMLEVKSMDSSEEMRTALIRSVDGVVDLASSAASAISDIGTAIANSNAFAESHTTGLQMIESGDNQTLINPYYLAAQKQRLAAQKQQVPAKKLSDTKAIESRVSNGLTLTSRKRKKSVTPLSCDERIRPISGTTRWDAYTCQTGDIAVFDSVRFESLYKCADNNVLFRDWDQDQRDECEGDVELIHHSRSEAGIHKPTGEPKYLYSRKYKCSCKPIQIKVQDGNSISR